MPSRQSEIVRRHWEASWRSMTRPGHEPVDSASVDSASVGSASPDNAAAGDGFSDSGPSNDGPEAESWGDLTKEPREVDYLETEAAGRPAMWIIPKRCRPDRVLLCLHGGGFISGSIYSHRKLFGHLAKASGARALLFAYRLAPTHIHPAQVEDAATVYQWLLDQGIESRHVAFTGDSAGGGLSITTQLLARQRGLPLPAAAMPFSPWVDMEAIGESYHGNRDRDPFFHRESVRRFAGVFLGERGDPRDPLANPLYADLCGLAPAYIQVGGDETLLDDARRLTEHFRLAGVKVRLDIFAGMLHTFQMGAGRVPEADEAIRRMARWVRPKLGLSGGSGDGAGQ